MPNLQNKNYRKKWQVKCVCGAIYCPIENRNDFTDRENWNALLLTYLYYNDGDIKFKLKEKV